ncbi:hypothetical protein LUZ63_015262 [Rhynchospora breviuscula]|uniref:Peroxisomal membrane protein PMP22 n=1 Tax=Rhynchospora breviuscula TaxID=2022672 RepID=A0A9Q0HLZ2_9POAL|nr:hypothetical protein LUZ63_015262 [Rhynchospora breviuscula]
MILQERQGERRERDGRDSEEGMEPVHASASDSSIKNQAGVLAGISDSAAQKLSGFSKIDLRRLLLKMLFGFAYGGPCGHFVHKVLDSIFRGKRDKKTVAKKVLIEQLTLSPCTHMLFLFYYGLVAERRPWSEVKMRVRKQYPSVQVTAWMFWPIIGWINHLYMPLQLRVIFHSFVACCWGIYF